MLPNVIAQLIEINRRFYREYAGAFAATRKRIQPGVQRILAQLPLEETRWLDLGCGSGALAARWAETGRRGLYLGLDFSVGLLEEARQATAGKSPPGLEIRFLQADLNDPAWNLPFLETPPFDGLLAFAVLHHIPGLENRRRLLEQARQLVKTGGSFILSVWQFQHSPKLMARCLPWETVALQPSQVEEGDYLLDWRQTLPEQEDKPGLRYVHLFDRQELAELATQTGYEIHQEFESDGKGGRLGLYQIWRVV